MAVLRKRSPQKSTSAASPKVVKAIDARFLESLLGYNCRRAALVQIESFFDRMVVFGLRPVEFSVLSLVHHNAGITSRQISDALGILSPNLVRLIAALDERKLLSRAPHPDDGRAIGLHLTTQGKRLMQKAESAATEADDDVLARLSAAERETLIGLLRRVYERPVK